MVVRPEIMVKLTRTAVAVLTIATCLALTMFVRHAGMIFADESYSEYAESPVWAVVGNDLVVKKAHGGSIPVYIAWVELLRLTGSSVRIDGVCLSACTFYLGLRDLDKVCATRRAVIGVHSPVNIVTGETDSGGIAMLTTYYRARGMSDLIDFAQSKGGWVETEVMYVAPAIQFVKECEDDS